MNSNTGFILTSESFSDGQQMFVRNTGEAENLSPQMAWSGEPTNAKSFALVCEDPGTSRGTWYHWGIYDIPLHVKSLPEGLVTSHQVGPFRQVLNDSGSFGYDGPMPPRGSGVHHYIFRLMALDVEKLEIKPSANVVDLMRTAEPHVVGEARITGLYER